MIKARPATLAVILLIAASLGLGARSFPGQAVPACPAVRRAIRYYYVHLRVGMTRGQVEEYFVRDGGMQFADKTRYDYPGCKYIHVDVYFKVASSAKRFFLPGDKVTRFSKLYLDYPVMD